ncbi:MAG: ABC transporter ATP-binding protein [Phyllobacteriaceae bacterium]|nr:ABC transporter ATP-binding protein [Phyllobacteriaceae bacterium]
MTPQSVELSGIGKRFGSEIVLDGIDLSIAAGEFVSLVGMSGCGKSTLLRILAGLETADHGRVSIGGRDVTAIDPSDRNLSMVFQSYALYPHMTVRRNIATPLRMRRLSSAARLPLLGRLVPGRREILADIDRQVEATAEMLHIDPLLERRPAQLSGGQRQRVALARAIVRSPAAFLMDEPLSNLDAKLRTHMREELSALHRRLGATFVYVTHDQVEAMTMSDRIALMEGGRILQFGTAADLYERPASLAVARFIGTPSINLLPVECDATGRLTAFGLPLDLVTGPENAGPAMLGVRPEDLRPAARGIAARLVRSERHGADRFDTLVPVADDSLRLVMRRAPGEAIGAGADDIVHLAVDGSAAHLFGADGLRRPVAACRRVTA